jgi:hypothetical protein
MVHPPPMGLFLRGYILSLRAFRSSGNTIASIVLVLWYYIFVDRNFVSAKLTTTVTKVSTILPAILYCIHFKTTDMKCPVCLNIQVDPCTLQCGHSICQLCLARLWKNEGTFCPVCKQTWREFPAISYNYRLMRVRFAINN